MEILDLYLDFIKPAAGKVDLHTQLVPKLSILITRWKLSYEL